MIKSASRCTQEKTITMVGINAEKKEAVIFNPRCKSWKCPYCAEKNSQDWQYRVLKGALELSAQGHALRFITLTSRTYATPTTSLYYFKQNWPKLQRRAKYNTEKNGAGLWTYIIIPEQHKTGVLHCHLIATTDLTSRWWHDNGYACGFGFQNKSIPVENPVGCAGYVTKYLAKSIAYNQWPPKFRRIRASQKWPVVAKPKPEGWEYKAHTDESAWFEYFLLKDYGYKVTDQRGVE